MFEGGDTSTGPFAEPTGDTSSIDVDSLLSDIESGRDTSGSGSSVPPSSQSEPAAPAQPTPAQEIEFTWNGKQIKAPIGDPRIRQWASQGYDYAQRMADFNRQTQEFQTRQQKIQEYESRYKPVEEYIEKNPQWWEHVNSEWQRAQADGGGLGADPNNPVLQKLGAYEAKLSKVEEFIQSQEAEKANAIRAQEDSALDTDIKSIRDTFKDLDWASPNAEGKPLELRVLEHMQANGISKFTAAFKDLMHEELLKRAEERGKESAVKERQKQTKLGLLGKSPAPSKGLTEARDHRNKSYDDLFSEGLAELGIQA